MAAGVFIDTSALLALILRSDALHEAARSVLEDLSRRGERLITSDWVLVEFLSGASSPVLRAAAVGVVASLREDDAATVVPATRRGFDRALRLYESRPDKGWSLVDCASMLTCRSMSVRRVLTHDRHVEQAGFEVLLRA